MMKLNQPQLIVSGLLIVLMGGMIFNTVSPMLLQAAPLTQTTPPVTQFMEVTEQAGVVFTGAQFGASWGDYNGDGWLDLFSNRHFQDPPGVYLNNRNGTFTNMYDIANIFPPSDRDGVFPPNNTPIRDVHGSCWGDFDNDGDLDLYATNAQLQITPFYVNQGDGTFKRDTSGQLDDLGGRGRTCSWIDVDNDGDLDLFKGNELNQTRGPNKIYRNNGNGQFTGYPLVEGATTNPLSAYGGAWADYDNDGDMDVVLTGEQDIKLFRNKGDGTFDSSDNKGLLGNGSSFRCWGGDFGDYDNDGDLDLYISCGRYTFFDNLEQAPQAITYTMLTSNEEDGFNFTVAEGETVTFDTLTGDGDPEISLNDIYIGVNKVHPAAVPFTLTTGAAEAQGQPSYTPGASEGVFIWQDLVTGQWRFRVSKVDASQGQLRTSGVFTQVEAILMDSLAGQTRRNNALYRNNGDSTFTLIGNAIAGVNSPADSQSGTWLDYDNDGWLDLYVVNTGNVAQGNEPNLLYRNNRNGSFTDVAAAAGVQNIIQGYDDCAAWGDYNHDGFVDLYVVKEGRNRYMSGPQKLYKNLGNDNHWLQVQVIGTTSNRQGIGAKVTIRSATLGQQFRQKNNGMHFMCQNSDILQFGLGADSQVETLTVKWPSGTEQTLMNVSANQLLTIVEGQTPTQTVVNVAPSIIAPREAGLVGSEFSVTLNPLPATDITIAYALTGTATLGQDYTVTAGDNVLALTPGQMTVKAGAAKATLKIQPLDDRVDDDDETIQWVALAGTGYQVSGAAGQAFVTVIDDDDFVGSLVFSGTDALTTTETGGQAKFTVKLDAKPKATVTVPVSSTDETKGLVSPMSLTFSALNWNIPQTVTVTGVNDQIDQADLPYIVQLGPTLSTDKSFDQLPAYTVTVMALDNDTAGFVVSAISGDITENGTSAVFSVSLATQPFSDVTLPLVSQDITEGVITPTVLTFSPLTWNKSQLVIVTGVNDDDEDGSKVFTIDLGPSNSPDAAYNGLKPPAVTVVNLDNDLPGTITGKVINANGRITARQAISLGNITVVAYRASGANWVTAGQTETTLTGEYTLTVRAGDYRLYYVDRMGRWAHIYYGQFPTFGNAITVTVSPNQTTPDINTSVTGAKAALVKIGGEVSYAVNPYDGRVTVMGMAGHKMSVAFEPSCSGGVSPSQAALVLAGQTVALTGNQAELSLPAALTTSDLTMQWLCGSQSQTRKVGQVTQLTSNPWGQVVNQVTQKPIAGARVVLYQQPLAQPDTVTQTGDCRINGAWQNEPPVTVTVGAPFNPETQTLTPSVNGLITGDNGRFAWAATPGCWYVWAQAEGYQPQTSPLWGVPPALTNLQISLRPNLIPASTYLPLIRR